MAVGEGQDLQPCSESVAVISPDLLTEPLDQRFVRRSSRNASPVGHGVILAQQFQYAKLNERPDGALQALPSIDRPIQREPVTGHDAAHVKLVGLVPDPPPLEPHPDEVSELLEVSLARLLEPSRVRAAWWPAAKIPPGDVRQVLMDPQAGYREVDDRRRHYKVYFFDIGRGEGCHVWGLTARIVMQILQTAFAFTPPEVDPTGR